MEIVKTAPARAADELSPSPVQESPAVSSRGQRAQAARDEAATDRVLISRFNQGDQSAFGEIVHRYRERIQRIAARFLRNDADAEEIAQDTFIRAYNNLGRFRGDASLATWLHRIAMNLARNRYWYFFRRRRHLTCSLDSPLGHDTSNTLTDVLPSGDADPAREATRDEFGILVTGCMEKLEAGHREILTLRNQLHYSYADIAQSLGINEGTVKSRIARARGKLRGLMVERCPEFSEDANLHELLEPANTTGTMIAA